MELEGEEDKRGPLESLGKRVLLGKMVLQDPLENRGPKDHREGMVNQDLKGLTVPPEKMDYQVIQAREESQASKARTDPLAPQASSDHRANLARRGQLEIEVIQVHQDRRENMVYREMLGRRVPRETPVRQEPRGKVALLDSKASEGAEGPLVQWVLQV